MTMISGWGGRVRGLFNDTKGPWGPKGSGDEPAEESRGPWGQLPGERRKRSRGASDETVSPLNDLIRRSRMRWTPGGGLPGQPSASMILWGVLGLVALWLIFTSFHSIEPAERGVVTRFGRYAYTLPPGVSMTLPSPIERVRKINVDSIRTIDLGSPSTEDLMLTGDQNIIDIAYSVRWSIRDPERSLFELAQPEETIRQVAESAMRAVVSRVSLDDAIGDRRSEIETSVADTMQEILDSYHSGVSIRGIAIKEADPPQGVIDAFKDVSAAQQDAQRYINAANAYSQQLKQKAEGEATAFEKVYEQYRLAPEVTRRRMYYETMEKVLGKVDKTIVEAPGVTPYLALPEIKKQQSQPQQAGGQ
jgi:membrane protease subunit HflK